MNPAPKERLSYREATAEDYQAVMDINRNIYDGDDYMPCMYHQYVQDPNRHCYVLEADGRVVGFLMFQATDDATACISQAGRAADSHKGKGIFEEFFYSAFKHFLKKYPNMTRWRWTTVSPSGMMRSASKTRARVVIIRYYLDRLTSADHLRSIMTVAFMAELSGRFPIHNVQHLSTSSAIETLSRRVNLSQIIPEGIWLINVEPYNPLVTNYEHIFKKEKYYLFGSQTDSGQYTAVSFGSSRKVQLGYRYRMDIYCNKDITDTRIVLAHVIKHIMYLLQYYKDGPVLLTMFLQSKKYQDVVESFLDNVLNATNGVIGAAEAYMLERRITSDFHQGKL